MILHNCHGYSPESNLLSARLRQHHFKWVILGLRLKAVVAFNYSEFLKDSDNYLPQTPPTPPISSTGPGTSTTGKNSSLELIFILEPKHLFFLHKSLSLCVLIDSDYCVTYCFSCNHFHFLCICLWFLFVCFCFLVVWSRVVLYGPGWLPILGSSAGITGMYHHTQLLQMPFHGSETLNCFNWIKSWSFKF
jgi:hypothetical protein